MSSPRAAPTDARAISTAISGTTASTRSNALTGTTTADVAEAVRGQRWRSDRPGPHVLLRERRATEAGSDRRHDHLRSRRGRHQRAALPRWVIPGQLVATGIYPNPVDSTNLLGKIDHQLSGRDQLSCPLQPVRHHVEQRTRRWWTERALGIGRTRQPSINRLAVSNTWTLSPRTVNETRAQFALQRPEGPIH